jgi:hypothetical protein
VPLLRLTTRLLGTLWGRHAAAGCPANALKGEELSLAPSADCIEARQVRGPGGDTVW